MVDPAKVTVLRIRLVMVLAGNVEVIVLVTPGRVDVTRTVEAGNCDTIVWVTAGRVIVERTVEAGSCEVIV